jgi:hypothetical protein
MPRRLHTQHTLAFATRIASYLVGEILFRAMIPATEAIDNDSKTRHLDAYPQYSCCHRLILGVVVSRPLLARRFAIAALFLGAECSPPIGRRALVPALRLNVVDEARVGVFLEDPLARIVLRRQGSYISAFGHPPRVVGSQTAADGNWCPQVCRLTSPRAGSYCQLQDPRPSPRRLGWCHSHRHIA